MYLFRVLIGHLLSTSSVVIGQSDYFGFGFTTLNRNPWKAWKAWKETRYRHSFSFLTNLCLKSFTIKQMFIVLAIHLHNYVSVASQTSDAQMQIRFSRSA